MILNIFFIYVAAILLSLSMNKHFKKIFNKNIENKFSILFKILGFTLLIICLFVFIKTKGISLGITYFIGLLTPIIFFISLIYTYHAKHIFKHSISLLFLSIFFTFIH